MHLTAGLSLAMWSWETIPHHTSSPKGVVLASIPPVTANRPHTDLTGQNCFPLALRECIFAAKSTSLDALFPEEINLAC
jgi:hypothetical protein